jgi:hypothetical protein
MNGRLRAALIGGVLLHPAASASSCPVCDQPTGQEVRAGIFDEDFGPNLFATTVPFGILMGLAALIQFGGRPRSTTRLPHPPAAPHD